MELGERIWAIVATWQYFERSTLGTQLVRAIDGVAANTAEATGRHHINDRRQFIYYARGSAREARCWLEKATKRNLIDKNEVVATTESIIRVERMLSALAASRMHTSSDWRSED